MAWSPADLTPFAWYDNSLLSSLTDAGSGHCSQQNDLSGNARHRLQAVDGQRPQMNTRAVNGLHVLDYDGVDDNLSVTGLTFGNPFTILGVYVLDTLTANRPIVDTVAGGDGMVLTVDTDADQWHLYNAVGVLDVDTGHAPTAGAVLSIAAVWNGASSAFYEDGVQYGGTVNTGTIAGVRIRTGNQGGNQLDGAECELVVVTSAVSAPNLVLWNGYVSSKWKTPLPRQHRSNIAVQRAAYR